MSQYQAIPGTGESAPLIKPGMQLSPPDLSLYDRFVQPCLVEFLGTAFYIFIACMSQQNELLLAQAIAQGLVIALLLISFGKISGGHFNPAVSLGMFLGGGLPPIKMALYWCAQLAGGLLGAAMTRGCVSYHKQIAWMPPSHNATVYEQIHGGAVSLQPEVSVWSGFFTEFIITMILMTIYFMGCLDSKTSSPTAGLSIGFTVVVCTIAGGPATKGAMNPVRAFSPAILVSDIFPKVWDDHWIYWLGPLLGAAAAGLLYRLLLAAEDRRLLFKKRN